MGRGFDLCVGCGVVGVVGVTARCRAIKSRYSQWVEISASKMYHDIASTTQFIPKDPHTRHQNQAIYKDQAINISPFTNGIERRQKHWRVTQIDTHSPPPNWPCHITTYSPWNHVTDFARKKEKIKQEPSQILISHDYNFTPLQRLRATRKNSQLLPSHDFPHCSTYQTRFLPASE